MIEISLEGFSIKESYSINNGGESLKVYGECWNDPSNILDKAKRNNSNGGGYDWLNFDGSYLATYEDNVRNVKVIFRSHQETFNVYYIEDNGKLIFSDSYYYLVSKLKHATWNLDAISDYFEDSWNHISKRNRTPLKEIKRLDSAHYIEINENTKEIVQTGWKKLDRSFKYTECNLDEFEEAFYKTLNYYLEKVHDKYQEVGISLSSGIDTNTIAACWSKKYPKTKTVFFTSKIDDITDESKVASTMQDRISAPIKYIPIKTDETDLIEELYAHMQDFVPPRFLNLLSERYFAKMLVENGITMPYITGMGADARFGEFSGEYAWLMNEYIAKGMYDKARNIYIAIQVSFGKSQMAEEELCADFDNMLKERYENEQKSKSLYRRLRHVFSPVKQFIKYIFVKQTSMGKTSLLRVSLPKSASSFIRDYYSAVSYASTSGENGDQALVCMKQNLHLISPYAGYKFLELSAQCDPYIFSNKVNKSCMRYAVRNLLPKEILSNKVKSGQPGVTYKKVFAANKTRIQDYLRAYNSSFVNVETLKAHVAADCFALDEFRALSLVVFEDILACKYKLRMCIPS